MKKLLAALFLALLMLGCGEDIEVPKIIACDACKKEVSSSANDCPNCGHPVADSVDAYVEKKQLFLDNDIPAEAIDLVKLETGGSFVVGGGRRKSLMLAPNTQTPYSGWAFMMWDDRQVYLLEHYKDGKPDGLWTEYHKNGQKDGEGTYKDGLSDGLTTYWYENGQKKEERIYKDDKFISVVAWKSNGEKCSETNMKDGNGVWVQYSDGGVETFRWTYKDGKRVSD